MFVAPFVDEIAGIDMMAITTWTGLWGHWRRGRGIFKKIILRLHISRYM
jgi:hypothetical protein